MNSENQQVITQLIADLEDNCVDISAQIDAFDQMMRSGERVNPTWYTRLHRARAAKTREIKKLKALRSGVPASAVDDASLRKQIQLENMRNATARKELQFLTLMKPQDLASRFMLAARQTLSADLYDAILSAVESDQEAA